MQISKGKDCCLRQHIFLSHLFNTQLYKGENRKLLLLFLKKLQASRNKVIYHSTIQSHDKLKKEEKRLISPCPTIP